MEIRDLGTTRRQRRQGAGGGAADHFDEMIGSTELNIFRPQNANIRGFEPLKASLDSEGCDTAYMADAPNPVGKGYETIRITNKDQQIPVHVLRRAHNWAHRRNLLHLFRKPGVSPRITRL